jgi:hypothetical protein
MFVVLLSQIDQLQRAIVRLKFSIYLFLFTTI